jgi:hypothetical protein
VSRPTRADPGGRAYLDLQNRARREGQATRQLLVLYALEGFLARLAVSRYAGTFVLKGGMLLAAMNARRVWPRTTPTGDRVARRRLIRSRTTCDPDVGRHEFGRSDLLRRKCARDAVGRVKRVLAASSMTQG